MQGQNALLKLISFKLFVLLTTLQNVSHYIDPTKSVDPSQPLMPVTQFVFNIVQTQVRGNTILTHQDISIGLPTLLLSIEGMLFMAAFHFSMHSGPYRSHEGKKQSFRSMAMAFLHALNPEDLIHGVWWALKSFFVKPNIRSESSDVERTVERVDAVQPQVKR